MEKEKLTDKEVYRNESAKKTFTKYVSTESVGHALDTLQITKTHTNGLDECTGQGSSFGGRGRKRYEHADMRNAVNRADLVRGHFFKVWTFLVNKL